MTAMRYMYVFLVGMFVGLEQGGGNSCEAVFDRNPAEGGLVIDASRRLFDHGSVLGLERARLQKLFPGVRYCTLDPGAHGEDYRALARACSDQSPQVEVEEFNRVFLTVGANQQPSDIFAGLSRTLVPGWGHTLVGAVAPSKYLAKTTLLWELRRAKKDAASYNYVRRPPVHEARVSTANRAYGQSTSVTLRLSEGDEAPAQTGLLGGVHRFQGGTLYTLPAAKVEAFLDVLPLQYLWPVPTEVPRRLRRLGFKTIGEVSRASPSRLHRLLGAQAEAVFRYARGLDWEGLRPNFPTPSLVQTSRFEPGHNVTPQEGTLLTAEVARLSGNLEHQLADSLSTCGQLTLQIDFYGGTKWQGTRRFTGSGRGQREQPDCPTGGLQLPALALLDDFLAGGNDGSSHIGKEVASLHLEATDLRPAVPAQLSLQDLVQPGSYSDRQANRRRLGELLAALKTRFPGTTLYVGAGERELPRREQMLSLFDPYRQYSGVVG